MGETRRNPNDFRVDITHDRPTSGMWHCGPNACWITATHIPTQTQVRLYSGKLRSQHHVRDLALMFLDMVLEETGADTCQFPEQVTGEGEHG